MERDFCKAVSSKTLDKSGHELIYNEFRKLLDHVAPSSCPPIQVLCYTARRILLPQHCWDMTPELLEILAQVEELRRRAADVAAQALEWNTFAKEHQTTANEDPDVFTESEVKSIKGVAASWKLREGYVHFCLQIRCEHVVHQLQSLNADSVPALMTRYFSPLRQTPNSALSLSDLSQEEEEYYVAESKACADLVISVEKWERKRELAWKEKWPGISHELLYGENKLLSYKSDFIRQFPPVYEWEKVVNLIVGWLEKVQGMVEDLQAPFDPLRRSSERALRSRSSNVRGQQGVSEVKAEPITPNKSMVA